jgi:hypothetical protein
MRVSGLSLSRRRISALMSTSAISLAAGGDARDRLLRELAALMVTARPSA